MSDLADFSALANIKVGEVEPPKALPNGHYQAIFTGLMKPNKAKSGNVSMRFPFKLVAPGEDVDAEALEAVGGIPDKEFTIDFWMSPDARFRFTNFVKAMNISEELGLVEAAEALATQGSPFLIQLTVEQNEQDPTRFFTRFDNPAPLA